MASLLVAVFDDQTGARRGGAILRDLHADGTLTLYAMAAIARRSYDGRHALHHLRVGQRRLGLGRSRL